ncbi:putative anti-sigma regulatory factor, serine/threonine protein kinase [Thalassoporum mexicanum PCC 7367]|uniref:ATP-binding protein n=1 Tax=Thalassoporum mexicanum TaxID=3457544 RepID=UPI00029FFAE7|nr:ATP-binding protein [Pseudanabaena sp. PCC 7367]AFY71691.1 putative anti-sigma regulatory factor, serine/threonine protein kinase [Pseudanabaena sp. PCC 7367]
MEPLTVPGKLDSLSPIAKYVMHAAGEAGLDKKAAYRLRLAVDEIVTNIILHGYEEAGLEGDVHIKADLDAATLTICVEDTGEKFDPASKEDPGDLSQPLENRSIGGLGVYLAFQGVDKFQYERTGKVNCNTFVMNRPQAE